MEKDHQRVEMSIEKIPETPPLTSERTQLSGIQKLLHDYRLGLIERKEYETTREILAQTRIQLLNDRVREIIAGYRIQAAGCRETIEKAANEYVRWFIGKAAERMSADANEAIKAATINYWNLVKDLDPGLPEDLRMLIINQGRRVLDNAIEEINKSKDYDVNESVKKSYAEPARKGFLSRLRG